ncbi:hypothetical protein [Streptomyces sp. NBC_01304]|uniref:hypothetical protein n=1 Tax=Streptomyces sp. NBC_01304 TaxID=2903818 RepID=UPI002E141807|nr:hypothetical protein OG430_05900 [Streptomyces sp. NBC_01304]
MTSHEEERQEAARDQELRRRLRHAAHAHRPDRERMLARIERGMAEDRTPRTHAPRAPRAPWLRVVGATAAVAGVFAVGGYGVASAVRGADPDPGRQTVATSPTPDATTARPSTPPTSKPTGSTRPPTSRPVKSPPTTSGTDRPPRTVPAADLVWADGSIDPGSSAFWAQSNITVKTDKPLTALTVELRVKQTGNVADTGNWRSLPAEDFDVSVRESDGVLVYRWTLKAGRTVPVGEFVFAGQYDHAEGERNADDDAYKVHAATAAEQADWKGDFE